MSRLAGGKIEAKVLQNKGASGKIIVLGSVVEVKKLLLASRCGGIFELVVGIATPSICLNGFY